MLTNCMVANTTATLAVVILSYLEATIDANGGTSGAGTLRGSSRSSFNSRLPVNTVLSAGRDFNHVFNTFSKASEYKKTKNAMDPRECTQCFAD